jgi:hypothetical protein
LIPLSPRDYRDREQQVSEFFRSAVIQLQALSEMRINLVLALRSSGTAINAVMSRSVDQLTRHVRLFGKCFRRFQQLGAQRFINLPFCNELVLYYWSKVVQAASGPSELIIGTTTPRLHMRWCNIY